MSLDLLIESDATELFNAGGFPEATTAGCPSNPNCLLDLKIDLSRVVSKLTSRQSEICHLLPEMDFSVQAVSDYLNLARSTLHREIKRIRAVFQAERLQEYLD